MNCLLFGGSGFIGSHLCEELLAAGHNVSVCCLPGDDAVNLKSIVNRIKIYRGDLTVLSKDSISAMSAQQDVIFHLVSTTLPSTSNLDMEADVRENVLPILRILEVCRQNDSNLTKKFVYLSSGGTVYGVPSTFPITEDHPTNPICSYGIHKLTAEKYVQMFGALYQVPYVILRLANPYGPRQNFTAGQGVILAYLNAFLRQQELLLWGDGNVVRDYIFIKDAVRAIVAATINEQQAQIYNIGSGTGTSLIELINVLERLFSYSVHVKQLPSRQQDVPANVLDIRRATTELHWHPEISLDMGLRLTLDYLRNQEQGIQGNAQI